MENKGHFKPGNPGKQKGTVHKNTRLIRNTIQNFIIGKLEEIEHLYGELEAKEKAKLLLGLMDFAVPKLKADVTMNGSDKKTETNVQVFRIGEQEIKF